MRAAAPSGSQAWRPRLPVAQRSPFLPALLMLAAAAVAVLVGLVVSTGNPLLMVVVVSPLIGLLLLANWRLCFWGVAVGFLLVNGPLQQFLPALGKLSWGFSGLSLLLMVLALVQMAGREREGELPRAPLAWLVLAMLVVVVLSSALISGRSGELLAGFKRYFQTWGLFFALAVLPVVERDLRRLLRLLIAVAVLHLPFALYQYFFVMPVAHLRSAGTYDAVVGLFEGSADGGGASGVMSLYLVVFIAVAFRSWLAERMTAAQLALALLVLGTPLALGETKAVVLVLPAALLLAAAGYYRSLRAWLLLLVFGAAILALGVHYISLNELQGASFSRALDRVLAYNIGGVGYDGSPMSLNRSTVLSHWWREHGLNQPLQTVFGHGLGASYYAASALAPGHLFLQYPFFNINLTTLSTLLWDLGLIGLASFLGLMLVAWVGLRRAIKLAAWAWRWRRAQLPVPGRRAG